MTRGIGVGLLFLLSAAALAQPQRGGGLAIRLRPSVSTVELGTRLALDIEYEHTGTRAFFVERSNVLGPSGINIIARRDRCSYPVRGIVSDFGAEMRQFRLIGLLPKDRMTERINEINGAGTEVPLPGPGAYAFHATFRSDGPVTSGTTGPIWRGSASSPEVEILMTPPNPVTLDRMQRLLRTSLQDGQTSDIAVDYFKLVRDPTAADLLVEVLEKTGFEPWLVGAVFFQRRAPDAPVLERAAAAARDPKLKTYAVELARRLRNPDSCD